MSGAFDPKVRGLKRTKESARASPSIARLFEATEVQEYDLHPDGGKAVLSVNSGANWELATLDLETGRTRTLVAGDQSLLSPTYSPSGSMVAYQADFEGNEDHDVFTVSADGRKRRRITEGQADNQEPNFSPEGGRIAFLSNRDDDVENLFVSSLDGKSVAKLSDEELPVRSLAWSPDGSRIAFETGIGDEDYVSVVDVAKRKVRKVLSKRRAEIRLSIGFGAAPSPWSPDGTRLLFASNENDQFDIGELDLGSRRRRWLVRSGNEKGNPEWAPDGTRLSYLEVEGPCVVLKVQQRRDTSVVSPKDGYTRSPKWLPDGSGVAMINGSSLRPEELFVSRRVTPKRMTSFQKRPLPRGWLVAPKVIRYRSFDGRRISALMSEPKDRSRRAGIVMPHGGPEMQTVDSWDPLRQMMLMKGFYVLEPNYRGSTGYGREFLHLHDKDLGGGDLKDVLYAGRYMVSKGLVDEGRLGFWGASYGGYLCMLALTKAPEMWAAGVSVVGFFDWETEMATERGYLKAYDRKKMGDPEKDPAFFRERSPAHFLDRLSAPLMMTASARDVRCPPTESRAVVKKLTDMGKPVDYHEYPDEGHWPRKRKNLIDLYVRTTDFLDEKILG